MIPPGQIDVVPAEDGIQKMVFVPDLCLELIRWVDRGIHLSPQFLLRWIENCNDVTEGCLADNQKIHVASPCLFTSGHRPVDEGKANSGDCRHQGCPKNLHKSHRLHHQPLEFCKDRAIPVRLEKDLVSHDCAEDDARI
jgi:hypothetical protein